MMDNAAPLLRSRLALLVADAIVMLRHMAFKKTKNASGGAGSFRSSSDGRFLETKSLSRSAHGSFGLPNGERISTVRKDIMDRALNRSPDNKR